ncbi:MAG TPA: cytochrome P450, partial [Pyrinomonadaceae bacterium]
TMRMEPWWNDPDTFDPERFTPAQVAARPRYAYFPFGGGPRVCIGNTFAMMEIVLLLATIAQKFRLSLVTRHPVELQPAMSLRPRNGIRMKLESRES